MLLFHYVLNTTEKLKLSLHHYYYYGTCVYACTAITGSYVMIPQASQVAAAAVKLVLVVIHNIRQDIYACTYVCIHLL